MSFAPNVAVEGLVFNAAVSPYSFSNVWPTYMFFRLQGHSRLEQDVLAGVEIFLVQKILTFFDITLQH